MTGVPAPARLEGATATDALVRQWVAPELLARAPYSVADAHGRIKLDAMENPYPLPASLRSAWSERLGEVAVHRYPDPHASAVVPLLRDYIDLADDQELVLGNGSDELIQMLLMLVAAPGRTVLSPAPSFVMYRLVAEALGLHYVGVGLEPDLTLDSDTMLAAIERHQPAIVFLAYPNNPTGTLVPERTLAAVLERAPGLVVIDEAYQPFAQTSVVPWLGRYPNLVVLRTLSKLGLAGLRFGFLAGPRPWAAALERIRLPYNINSLSQAAVAFALEHRDVFEEQAAQINAERARLQAALQAMPGLEPFPSAANFVLVRTPAGAAERVFRGLYDDGILVKNVSGQGGVLRDCLRLTVGTPQENDRVLDALARHVDPLRGHGLGDGHA